MTKRGHIPVRTCIGCRQRAEQHRLVRLARSEGRVCVDSRRRLGGRGAWIHRDPKCMDRALARRGSLSRAFRRDVGSIEPEAMETLRGAILGSMAQPKGQSE